MFCSDLLQLVDPELIFNPKFLKEEGQKEDEEDVELVIEETSSRVLDYLSRINFAMQSLL